jgi:hypothetical protein
MTLMATTNTVGIREQLFDLITNIAPTETPFLSMIQRGAAARNTKIEWQTDTLAAANGSNAAIEGADASYLTVTPTVRLATYTQIMTKAVQVTDTMQEVTAAGRSKQLAYALENKAKELKNDMEARLTGNFASRNAATTSTARLTAGFESWITTNDSRGTGGTQGGYNSSTQIVSAATDASTTNRRTFTEARLKAVIKSCWDAGGEPSLVMVGSWNKQQASSFEGNSTKYNIVDRNTASNQIVAAADLYVSDFGVMKIVPNRFSRARSALVIDPALWKIHYLRPFETRTLAKTGDSEKRQIVVEFALASANQAGNGIVADLRES